MFNAVMDWEREMSVTPVIAGRLYLVRHAGETRHVIAAHPIDALMSVFSRVVVWQ